MFTSLHHKIVRGSVNIHQWGAHITKGPMWVFHGNYVTQNNMSSYLLTTVPNAMRVFYHCSELRGLRQTSTRSFLCKVRMHRETGSCT